MIKLKIEILKLFILEFEWIRNKKKEEIADEQFIEVIADNSDNTS